MAKIVLHCINPELELLKRRLISLEDNAIIRVGRAHKNELPLEDNALFRLETPFVSYKHVEISFCNRQFFLKDKSTNGTFINKIQVEKGKSILIKTGDIIQLGKNKIRNLDNLPTVNFALNLYLKSQDEDDDSDYILKIENEYPNVFSIYNEYPCFEIPLESLNRYLLERFEVLQLLNKFGDLELNRTAGISPMVEEIKQKDFIGLWSLITYQTKTPKEEYSLRNSNHASHFILRIACCRNFPLRLWFTKQETKLMYIQWHFLPEIEKLRVFNMCHLNYPKILASEMQDIVPLYSEFIDGNNDYFKVPFDKISQKLKMNDVIIEKGFVFVTIDDIIYSIIDHYRHDIEYMMMDFKKRLHHILDDSRIKAVINYVENNVHFDRYSFSQREAKIQPKDVEKLSEQSFPLCMKILQSQLTKEHHLRNGGRFQYGLFLKGIGLSLPNALIFWRYHFTRKIDVGQFIKDYSYHIKHIYGAVGKMADYPPKDCKDIMKAAPGPLDYHGCPFKTLDKRRMKVILRKNNFNNEGENAILDLMDKGMYQVACSKYFDITHETNGTPTTTHPNLYYESSRKVLNLNDIEIPFKKRNFGNDEFVPSGACHCKNKSLDW